MDEAHRIRIERLRWQCRRALLELDIVLQRFWDRNGGSLDDATLNGMERLLVLEDHDLWELVSGRRFTDDMQMQQMAKRLNLLATGEH
jgi:antitoxin CptB